MKLPRIHGEFVVVKEPEVKFATSGLCILGLRLKANKSVRDSNGTWQDGPTPLYIDGTVFGKLGEHAADSILVGEVVIIDGFLEQQEWVNPEGEKRSKVSIVVDEIGLSPKWGKVIGRKMQENEGTSAPYEPASDAPPF